MNDFEAVLFDLDGTLIDTAPDMGGALNLLLQLNQCNTVDLQSLRPHVSHGSTALIKMGFNIGESNPQFLNLRDHFLDLYEQNIAISSTLFDGMEQVLEQLEQASIPWGIVTNKPGYLTDKLLLEMNLHQRASTVISGDTLELRKPHPEPLFAACNNIDCNPKHCLYVGDAERDIQAAQAAGMKSCTALYGYYTHDEDPKSWNADLEIESAFDLLKHINFNPELERQPV